MLIRRKVEWICRRRLSPRLVQENNRVWDARVCYCTVDAYWHKPFLFFYANVCIWKMRVIKHRRKAVCTLWDVLFIVFVYQVNLIDIKRKTEAFKRLLGSQRGSVVTDRVFSLLTVGINCEWASHTPSPIRCKHFF